MTVLQDRIKMADANTERLDEWFERLERMPVREGFRVKAGRQRPLVSPGRRVRRRGHLRGHCRQRLRAEKGCLRSGEVPVYVIADPYQGRCYVYTHPKDGDYAVRTSVDFGTDIDLTDTVVDLVLKTDGFPRD